MAIKKKRRDEEKLLRIKVEVGETEKRGEV